MRAYHRPAIGWCRPHRREPAANPAVRAKGLPRSSLARHTPARERVGDRCKTFAGDVVDDVQDTESPAAGELAGAAARTAGDAEALPLISGITQPAAQFPRSVAGMSGNGIILRSALTM